MKPVSIFKLNYLRRLHPIKVIVLGVDVEVNSKDEVGLYFDFRFFIFNTVCKL